MTKKSLIIAGWLAVISAAVEIPQIVLYVFAQDIVGVSGGKLIEAIINVTGLALYVALMLRLKQFLKERFNFAEVDNLLNAMILINAVTSAIYLIGIIIDPVETFALVLSFIACVALGAIGVVYSIKLLRLQDDLFGLLKPYAYSQMIASIATASVVLLPLSILVGIASYIMLAMIFFRAAETETSPAQAVLSP